MTVRPHNPDAKVGIEAYMCKMCDARFSAALGGLQARLWIRIKRRRIGSSFTRANLTSQSSTTLSVASHAAPRFLHKYLRPLAIDLPDYQRYFAGIIARNSLEEL